MFGSRRLGVYREVLVDRISWTCFVLPRTNQHVRNRQDSALRRAVFCSRKFVVAFSELSAHGVAVCFSRERRAHVFVLFLPFFPPPFLLPGSPSTARGSDSLSHHAGGGGWERGEPKRHQG